MKSLVIDINTKDLKVTEYNLSLTTNNFDYISQKIETKLKYVKGEWFLNRNNGLPYFTDIFKKNPDIPLITSLFRSVLLGIDGVIDILDFTIALNNSTRVLTINYEIQIDTGETLSGTVGL